MLSCMYKNVDGMVNVNITQHMVYSLSYLPLMIRNTNFTLCTQTTVLQSAQPLYIYICMYN